MSGKPKMKLSDESILDPRGSGRVPALNVYGPESFTKECFWIIDHSRLGRKDNFGDKFTVMTPTDNGLKESSVEVGFGELGDRFPVSCETEGKGINKSQISWMLNIFKYCTELLVNETQDALYHKRG